MFKIIKYKKKYQIKYKNNIMTWRDLYGLLYVAIPKEITENIKLFLSMANATDQMFIDNYIILKNKQQAENIIDNYCALRVMDKLCLSN